MSSLPLLLNLVDELDRESYNPFYFGNDFGLGLYPHHIHSGVPRRTLLEASPTSLVGYTLPALLEQLSERKLARRNARDKGANKAMSAMSCTGKDGFQVCMDVAQFKPSELNVKVLNDSVVVEGKHEEREDDHGYISRHFVRRYALPKGYDAEKVVSTLSSDGVLTVSVPKPPAIEDKTNARVVQIQQTGPAHLNIKPNTEEAEKIGDVATNGEAKAAAK